MVLTRREARAKKRKQKQEEKQKQKKASNSKPDEETRDAPSSGEEEIVQTSRSAAKPTGPRGSLVDVQEDGGFGFDNLGDSPVGPNSYEGNEYQHDEQEDDYFGADENGDDGVDDGEKGEDSAPSNDEENYEQDGGYFGDDGSRNSEDDGTSRLENREGNIDGTDHGFGGENFASSEDEGSYQGEDGFYGNIGSRNSQDEDGSELETGDNRDGSLPTGEPKELANNDDNSNQDDMSAGSGENSDDGDEDQFNSSFKGRYNGYGSDAHNEEEGELPGNEPDAKRDGFNLQDSPENFDDNKEGAGGVTGAEDYSNVMEGRNSDNYKYDFDDPAENEKGEQPGSYNSSGERNQEENRYDEADSFKGPEEKDIDPYNRDDNVETDGERKEVSPIFGQSPDPYVHSDDRKDEDEKLFNKKKDNILQHSIQTGNSTKNEKDIGQGVFRPNGDMSKAKPTIGQRKQSKVSSEPNYSAVRRMFERERKKAEANFVQEVSEDETDVLGRWVDPSPAIFESVGRFTFVFILIFVLLILPVVIIALSFPKFFSKIMLWFL